MIMNAELDLAWEIIEHTGANLFLTGKAGTGKTTFLKELKVKSPKRMVVLAPTGIAAINAGGVTIHSFFQLPLSPFVPGVTYDRAEKRYFRFGKIKRDIIRTLDLLVIDEISMVRADLLDAVDSVMRRYRDHDKPFGGAQLLMIGDLQQLAPVVKDDEWALLSAVYDTPYFFSSKALAQAGYHTVELKTVYRQQDMSFVALLNQIRENKATDATLDTLNQRYIPGFKPDAKSDYIRLTTHNFQAQTINDLELSSLPGHEYTFNAEVKGVFPESSYPADKGLILKQGAQVMFIKNDPDKRFYNGMIGEVIAVSNEDIIVKGKKSSEAFRLEKAEWTNSKYTLDNGTKEIKETVEGVFRQYPLKLAWAITIHKSQGLTFDHAIIDVSHSFAHGQAYVALSRCKTLDGIVLSAPLRHDSLISDEIVERYIDGLDLCIPNKSELLSLKLAYFINLLDELFDFTTLHSSFRLLLRTIDEHFYSKYPKLLTNYKNVGLIFNELIDVARKFKVQYSRLSSDVLNTDDAYLYERIRKASKYFSEKLEDFLILLAKTKISTDNKIIKQQFEERFATFSDELIIKKKLLEYESQDHVSFSTGDYLTEKAKIILNLNANDSTLKHEKKLPRAKKTAKNTREISFDMFKSGMTIGQIAKERGLVADTVMGHLAYFVKAGLLGIDKVIPQSHIEELQTFLVAHPRVTSISEVKGAVNPVISYSEIRLFFNVNNVKS